MAGWTAEIVRDRLKAAWREYAWLARYGHVSPTEARKLTIADRRRMCAALSELIDEENRAMEAGRGHD